MDLADQIQDKINALDLGVTVNQGYLTGKQATEIVLYSLPGGTVVEEDFAGNKTERYMFEVTMRSQDQGLINQTLFKIAELINDPSFTLTSNNNSFHFTDVEMIGFPHVVSIDVEGFAVYSLDFAITIDVMTNQKG